MENYNFQKLTPINDVELNVYESALDFVFKNDDIKNIAISGAYSAGKSSILETYKKQQNNIRFLHISLAHFKSSTEKEDEKAETKESVLEGKILNQLIHQIDSDKIPQTNFKVKRKVNGKKIAKTVLLIMFLAIMILHLTMFSSWQAFVNNISVHWLTWLKHILTLTTYNEARLSSGIISTIILGVMLTEIIKAQKNKNILKKISLQGNEIEIFEESKDSYFDKYLNEVLYLFENADADVIVFEDMDRYNANQIFQRLREVNTLVNNQRKNDEKPLRFFYLLRDDIFVSKDRTKFFDYIMPVVPVIDSSNSYDQFIEHFKLGSIFELFDESFLQGISLYVDDMRILKNIYNEFVVYNNRINTTEQDHNKLLALIIYKNIFPRDFSELQLNKGFVYTLFMKKDEFISNEIKNIEMKIKELREKVESANSEHLSKEEEVDKVYADEIQRLRRSYYREQELHTLEEEIMKRKEAIENKSNDKIDILKQKIANLENKKLAIYSKKLYQIITRQNIKSIFEITYINEIGKETDFNEIKESNYFDLIKYLIRNGYIDETYADYMTYFYENSLSRIDKTFLRSITDKKAKEYTYKLKNPQMVVDRLSEVSFDEEEILNFDLLCHLLATPASRIQLNRVIQQLMETENYRFIKEFLNTERQQEQFVKNINLQWNSFFYAMLNEYDFLENQIKVHSVFTLYFSSEKEIKSANIENCLTDYISNNIEYLDIESPNIEKLISGFRLMDVCFVAINYDTANIDLFTAVYEKSLYQININNMILMLKVFYGIEETKDFYHKSYTLISSSSETPLAQYINENINDYISIILDNCESNIIDDEAAVLSVLNNDEITSENKVAYIEVLKTQIQSLKTVDDKETWGLLLESNLIEYSEDNILEYFFCSGKKLDNILAEFINSQNKHLDFSDSISNYGNDASSNFFVAAIVCNNLRNDKYTEIMKSLNRCYNKFQTEGISKDKIDILIDLKIIRISLESLIFMRENYSLNTIYFIEKNIDSYVDEIISDDIFDFDEMMDVLHLDVSDENKINLIQFTDEVISIIDSDYSDTVKIHILNNNLDENDISHLLISYPKESSDLKTKIESLTIEYKNTIFTESYQLSIELFEKMISSAKLSNEEKIEFLIIILPTLDEGQAITYLNNLRLNDYVRLFDRGRPKFEVNDVNERMLETFKDKHWITKYEIDKDDSSYYRAFGRKLQEELPNELL